MADHPLRPATDRRLGRPLPHQPANRTQAPHTAHCCFHRCRPHAVLAPVSQRYPPLRVRFLRVTHPSATRATPERIAPVRLACLRYAASVCPEPGSNSPSKSPLAGTPSESSDHLYSLGSRSSIVKVHQTKTPPHRCSMRRRLRLPMSLHNSPNPRQSLLLRRPGFVNYPERKMTRPRSQQFVVLRYSSRVLRSGDVPCSAR